MAAPVFVSAAAADASVGAVIRLDGAEGRHAAKVQRLAVGERIDLVDGRGARAAGSVTAAGQDWLEVAITGISRDADAPVTLVQALAKGGRDEQAVEAATELGVTAITPWAADRSIVQWRGPKADKGREAWAGVAYAAAKQSRRALVPSVAPVHTSKQLVTAVETAVAGGQRVLVLHEAATVGLASLTWARPDEPVWLVVGPEGGISDGEVSHLEAAGAETVLLGPHVLRSSTAGPAALAALAALRGGWASPTPTLIS